MGTHTRFALFAVAAALTAGCSNISVVDTGENPHTETAVSPPPPLQGDPNLVDAFDFFVTSSGVEGYYFTTPSGRWSCAILPHTKAGCQSASGAGAMGIPGAPERVPTADGDDVAPNAIAVGDEGEPGFTWLDQPGFASDSAAAKVLEFHETLAAAGFRCNVQETGVSCLRDATRKGFTFSSDGYLPHYTPVPD